MKKIIYLLLAIFIFSTANAQKVADTIRRELLVVNSETLSISKSTPLEYRLALQKPQIKYGNLNYDIADFGYSAYNISDISNISFDNIPYSNPQNQKGFVDLSFGLMSNARLKFAYNILNSKDDYLNISLNTIYSNYKYSIENFKNTIKYNDVSLNLDYRKRINMANMLYASANFYNSNNNLYGVVGDTYSPNKSFVQPIRNMTYLDLNAGLLDTKADNLAKLSYATDIKLSLYKASYSNLPEYMQQSISLISNAKGFDFNLKPRVSYNFNAENAIALNTDLFASNTDNKTDGKLSLFANIRPNYQYYTNSKNIRFSLKAGFGLTLERARVDNFYFFSPYLDISSVLMLDKENKNSIDLSLLVDGGDEAVFSRDYFRYSPFSYYLGNIDATKKLLGANLSIAYKASGNANISLSMSYDNFGRIVQNNTLYFSGIGANDLNTIYFSPDYNKYSRLSFSLDYKQYFFSRSLDLDAFLRYNIYSKDRKEIIAQPDFETRISLNYLLGDWSFSATYKVLKGLKYQNYNHSNTNISYSTLDMYQNLAIRANYNVNKNISFYIDGSITPNNDNNQYYIYYPEQYATLLIGFDYKF